MIQRFLPEAVGIWGAWSAVVTPSVESELAAASAVAAAVGVPVAV